MVLTKEDVSKKFFRDIKPKHLKEFEEETPQGNVISGYICKKPNHYLGSMLIQKIKLVEKDIEFETEQFVQAMPKINYYSYKNEMYQDSEVLYNAYEKLDGSCLILYGLYYEDEVVEIVPKTRGIPVADKHIIEMYNELDHANIEQYFSDLKKENPTLLFELYGTMNLHSIFYPKIRIDIKLIGATLRERFLDSTYLEYICSQYDFETPEIIFKLVYMNSVWKIKPQVGFFYYYLILGLSDDDIEDYIMREYPTQYDVFNALKDMLTTINKNHIEKRNRLLLEGVVVDTYDKTGEKFSYIKVKSSDIEEKCRTENGIPRKFILKEIQKYFDEYGSNAKELYKENPNHVIDYVNRNLLEEFNEEAVKKKKTQNRISNVFLDMLEAKEPPKGLQDICHSLVEQYPNSEVSDLMRIFAQEYPEKKRYASMVYGIFEKIV